jgi:hypothetical protein
MNHKVIPVETSRSIPQFVLQRVLRMVPDRDKNDRRLRRLLAFRVEHDGEAATCEYLMRHIRNYIRRPGPRSFYDFLIQPHGSDPEFGENDGRDPDPPGAA